jgi:hypothetical protein
MNVLFEICNFGLRKGLHKMSRRIRKCMRQNSRLTCNMKSNVFLNIIKTPVTDDDIIEPIYRSSPTAYCQMWNIHKRLIKQIKFRRNEIWDLHGGGGAAPVVLGCDAVWTSRSITTFRTNMLFLSSALMSTKLCKNMRFFFTNVSRHAFLPLIAFK